VYFGIEAADRRVQAREHASDVKACPRCAGPIAYSMRFLGHLGHYRCPTCGFARPTADVEAHDVRLRGVAGTAFGLVAGHAEVQVELPLPGLYNVYNALGAAATAMAVDIALSSVVAGLQSVTPAFGRMEQIEVRGRTIYLALAKNPSGLNEVLRTLLAENRPLHLLMMLNDNIADGRDVSWIWDADVEMLESYVATAVFAGTRAEDMALRFKYAGVIGDAVGTVWEVYRDTRQALDRAVELTPEAVRLFVVPTYTAMLDVRKTLSDLGYARPYWEE
jgi:UDP-N-acetylmuramyl tripeptide synthase